MGLDDSAVASWAEEELWCPDGNVFGTVLYVDDATWARLCEEVGAETYFGGCIVVNEVTDADRAGERPFSEALLVVGVSFAVSAYLAVFVGDAASGAQTLIGAVGIALPALVILLAIRHYNGFVAS